MSDDRDRLNEIRERLQRASAGPWRLHGLDNSRYYDHARIVDSENKTVAQCWSPHGGNAGDQGTFVAHGREDIPWLLATITRLQAIVDKLPKTADGVPVWPGMPVYVNWADADREQQRVFFVHPVEHPGDTGALFHDDVVVPLEIAYSTPEAAEQAKENAE